MVELDITVAGTRFDPRSAAPLMLFDLAIVSRAVAIENIQLQCQLRIEPTRRSYAAREKDRLSDLFGRPERWDETLGSFLWTHAAVSVARFEDGCAVALPVPCSLDFTIAATKYFDSLEDGCAPLSFHFSGPVFYRDADGRLQIAPIPTTQEAAYALPVATWRAMIDHHYPDSVLLRLDRGWFDRLEAFRRENGLPSTEAALAALISRCDAPAMAREMAQ
jgi:hypothetical protein